MAKVYTYLLIALLCILNIFRPSPFISIFVELNMLYIGNCSVSSREECTDSLVRIGKVRHRQCQSCVSLLLCVLCVVCLYHFLCTQ